VFVDGYDEVGIDETTPGNLAWDEATHRAYQAKLQGSAELRAVLRNPFVLYLLWQSWER
jgi:hypothetical protein